MLSWGLHLTFNGQNVHIIHYNKLYKDCTMGFSVFQCVRGNYMPSACRYAELTFFNWASENIVMQQDIVLKKCIANKGRRFLTFFRIIADWFSAPRTADALHCAAQENEKPFLFVSTQIRWEQNTQSVRRTSACFNVKSCHIINRA